MITRHEPEQHEPEQDGPEESAGSAAPDDAADASSTRPELATPGAVAPGLPGGDITTIIALAKAELAGEAHQRQPAGTSETQPMPIVTALLRPLDSIPSARTAPDAEAAEVTAAEPMADVAEPVEAQEDKAVEAAEAAPVAEEAGQASAPKIPFPPPALLPEDDPNATNQLLPSSGLTGLDVLGALEDSSDALPFAAAVAALTGDSGAGLNAGPPEGLKEGLAAGIADEVDPNWAMADQPTLLALPPRAPKHPDRPAFLETGEQDVWPPRPAPATAHLREDGETPPPFQPSANPRPIPRPATRPILANERLASPTGKRPLGNTDAAYSDPRMRRYVELQLQRGAHQQGQRGPVDLPPVAQMVRQWWSDLMPGLRQALDHQHEARASGVYPLPAHDTAPNVGTRLGDVFGRLGAAVRDLGGRAQSAALPALKELHERAEQAAQAIVGKIEGPQVRQQAPFLGPGRVAVFFRQGVTVGQAQRLLLVHRAQPMRLIPRKHGFLARVMPGRESEVGAELRKHPFVRDVVYLEYEDQGDDDQAAAR